MPRVGRSDSPAETAGQPMTARPGPGLGDLEAIRLRQSERQAHRVTESLSITELVNIIGRRRHDPSLTLSLTDDETDS